MTIPAPSPGLVIRYSFLWSRDKDRGASEGVKDRPCAIVLAIRRSEDGEIKVVVAPITHSPPSDPAAIEIPSRTRRSLGLDDERQWIAIDELNAFSWPGFDLRPIPGRRGQFVYGMLPEALYERMRVGILRRDAEGKARRIVDRD